MKLFLLSLTTLISFSAHAKHVGVDSVQYTYHCGYYSSSHASLRVAYSNPDVPMNAKVKLIEGWGGYVSKHEGREFFSWQDRQELVMIGVESSSWAVEFSKLLHYRSSSHFKDTLQFVFEIQLPNGHVYWDKGNDSAWGYYQATLPAHSSTTGCLNPGELPGAKSPVEVTNIEKH